MAKKEWYDYPRPLFRIRNISKTFRNGQRLIFCEENEMCIQQGCFTLITGDSGVGKSTLLNILGLLDWADRDKMSQENATLEFFPSNSCKAINYFDLYRKDSGLSSIFSDKCAEIRRKWFGFLPQHGHLLSTFSVGENLLLMTNLRPTAKDSSQVEAMKILSDFIGKKKKQQVENFNPTSLSGGEAQRVALTRAISDKPLVIFVDEPTTYLDKPLISKTVEVFADLTAGGCSIILITHEYDSLFQLFAEVALKSSTAIVIDHFNLSKEYSNKIDSNISSEVSSIKCELKQQMVMDRCQLKPREATDRCQWRQSTTKAMTLQK